MKKQGVKDNEGPKFINYDFDKDTKAQFREWADDNREALGDLIDKVCDSGYGISCKPDKFTGGFASFMQPVDTKSPNLGWVLSGRASGPVNAMLSVLYRHLVVFQGDWPRDDIRRAGFDDE